MDLINPRIAIGSSKKSPLDIVILYQEKGLDKLIDYSLNLVMEKTNYYELFNFKEINVINKYELYSLFYIFEKLKSYENICEFLLFNKEIFKELSQKEMFTFLGEKYDQRGINLHNYTLIGDNSETLFIQEEDSDNRIHFKLKKELDEFTKKPTKRAKHIKYDKKREKYILKERNFGFFTFSLISDIMDNEKEKQILLSEKRYHHCHENSIILARSLSDPDKSSAYVVGGKIKVNDIDYVYHSWIEIENKNIVVDFNHNIVMNRDKYYKLHEAVPINKTRIQEMEQIIQTVLIDADLNFHPMMLNYFGKELTKDIHKSKVLTK